MNNTPFNNHSTNGSNSPYGQNDNQPQLDPSLGFNGGIDPNALDFNNLQNNPLLQQRLNETRPTSQPQNFQGAGYSVNPVVPAKRPRGGDDNVGASPHPSQGHQGGSSGSQTPQQGGFPNTFPNQQMSQVPNPYQHLQQQSQLPQGTSSNHATPSPAPSNQQQFHQPGQPPTSNSPHQFNQNVGNFPQMQNRPNAPQTPNNPGFMRGGTPQTAQGVQNGAMSDAARQQYQLRLQQAQLQAQAQMQGNNMANNRQPGQVMGQTSNPGMGVQNGPQMDRSMQAQMQGQAPQTQPRQQNSSEQGFMKTLNNFLLQRGQSLETDPTVSGRPINYFNLFQEASKRGVINPNATQENWSAVASALGFPPNQYPTAIDELRGIFQRNLIAFSQFWTTMMQKRKMQMLQQQQQQQQQPGQQAQQQQRQQQQMPQQHTQAPFPQGGLQIQPPQQQQMQMGGAMGRSQQMSPSQPGQQFTQGSPRNENFQGLPQQQPSSQPPAVSQNQRGTPVQARASSPQTNGLFSPQGQTASNDQAGVINHQRSASSMQPNALPAGSPQAAALQTPQRQLQSDLKDPTTESTPPQNKTALTASSPSVKPDEKSDEFRPGKRYLSWPKRVDGSASHINTITDPYYGGLPTDTIRGLGKRLSDLKPGVPTFEEMATVDVHALTMSIQSGIYGEMRYALDQLVGLSNDVRVTIPLHECEVLVEALIECGEDQLERLAGAAEVMAATDLPLVEELAKDIARDGLGVQNLPSFGTTEYELKTAADRLIAISTILRNLSCPDHLANHEILAGQLCINFIASIIRTMTTRRNLLRSAQNTQDVMKDIVTMLSQISHRLEIPSEDDALSLLQLLVSFAPAPPPTLSLTTQSLTFTPYDPKTHQYLPSAIDALAKLLARDDPNRTYYKSIFACEPTTSTTSQPHSLLTRAFSLAIAPIPDRHAPHIDPLRGDLVRLAHARNPFFSQGMLAADILASLVPGPSDRIARMWLESEDSWAPSLLHLLIQLSYEAHQGQNPRQVSTGKLSDWEMRGLNIITTRGLSMLKRLVEKVERASPESKTRGGVTVNGTTAHSAGKETKIKDVSLAGILPDRDVVLRALTDTGFEIGALKQLLAFAALEG